MQKCLCPYVNMPDTTRYFLEEENYNAYYDFRMKDHMQRTRVIKTYEVRYWNLYDACDDDPAWAKDDEDNDEQPQMDVEAAESAPATVGAAAAAEETGEDWVYDSEEDCFVNKNSVRGSPCCNTCVLKAKCMCPQVVTCVSSCQNACVLMHRCALNLTGA